MTIFQGRNLSKPSGGKLKAYRSKKRHELGREPTFTRIGPEARKVMRTMGGNSKVVLMRAENVNVYVPAEKVTKKVKIQTVKENPSNPHYVQRNILGKGTVILTELGEARVTSRPGQDGIVNAVLL
jgi:small subunit ribosomal protein S8e